MRRVDILAVLLLIGVAINSIFFDGEKATPDFRQQDRTPPIELPDESALPEGNPVPAPDLERDPTVFIKPDTVRANSTGTAFSIDDEGYWLTARHVVDNCDRIFLIVDHERRKAVRVAEVALHPVADVAMLRTKNAPPALRLVDRSLTFGEVGFGLGYPKGDPGDIAGKLMGRASLQVIGRRGEKSPLLVWSEQLRMPDRAGSLGGLSGGPMLDTNGAIVGVVVAESARRGRVMTADLDSVNELFQAIDEAPDFRTAFDAGIGQGIKPDDFHRHGARLRDRLTIAKAVCLVD